MENDSGRNTLPSAIKNSKKIGVSKGKMGNERNSSIPHSSITPLKNYHYHMMATSNPQGSSKGSNATDSHTDIKNKMKTPTLVNIKQSERYHNHLSSFAMSTKLELPFNNPHRYPYQMCYPL
jgi:hypothetical protein